MPYYLIPELRDSAREITDLTTKAGVDLVLIKKLYDLAPVIPPQGIVILSIGEDDLMVLMRNMQTLLPELPTAVVAAPDLTYSAVWNRLAAPLPDVDWSELSGKMAKSGLLSNDTEQASSRSGRTDRERVNFARHFDDNPADDQDKVEVAEEDEDPTAGI